MGSTLTRLCSFISWCVCVCLASHAIVSPSLLSNDTSGTWTESGQTNTHSLSFPLSFALFLTDKHARARHKHTNTHKESHRNVVLYCWREGALRFTASPWNVGTSELWSASKKLGVLREGRGVRKPQELQWPPMGWLCLFMCVRRREWEAEGNSLTPVDLFLHLFYPWLFLVLSSLQAGVGPRQLQSNTSLHRARVQALHFPIPPARPWTGKGKGNKKQRDYTGEIAINS